MTNDEDYQDTFCDWVGEIPKDWNMTRGRFLFNSKKEIKIVQGTKITIIYNYKNELLKDF